LAEAATAEITAYANRESYLHDDYILSGAKATLQAADGQVEEFFSVTTLAGTVLCTTTPLVAMIAGKRVAVSVDTGVTIANGLNVVYLHQDGTFTVRATFPTISTVQPAAPATHDHWYDISGRGTMYKYSGSAWVATPEIPVCGAYAVGGSVVTGCVFSLSAGLTMHERYENIGEPVLGDVSQVGGTYNLTGELVHRSFWAVGGATVNHTAEPLLYIPMIRAQWIVLFDGTSTYTLTGLGGRKATAGTGAGGAPSVTACAGCGSGGAGGGSSTASGGNSASAMNNIGSSAGAATGGGVNTIGGAAVAVRFTTALRFRGILPVNFGVGGGGGSGAGDGTAGGDSGAGGGRIWIVCGELILCSGAVFRTDGAAGTTPGAGNRGGGGGGAAGFIYMFAKRRIDRGATYSAAGGAASNGSGTGGGGPAGASNNIKWERWS
jgi:hypothetical protein